MADVLVLGSLAFAALVVLAVLGSVMGLVLWLVFLPFRLMGWVMKGIALLLALPFVVIFGIMAFVALGGAMLMFLAPLLPFVLIAAGAWWLVRRPRRPAAPVTG